MKKLSLIIFIIIYSVSPISTMAQNAADSVEYVQDLSENINFKINVNDDIESFTVTTPGTKYELSPNTNLNNSYGFSYKFISFSFTYNPRFINRNVDDDEKGETKITKYSTNLALGTYINQYLSFQKITGYYLENTDDFNPTWESGDPYVQFPDLNYLSWHGITSYKSNPNFSIFALTASNQRQVKSAGSFLYSLSYRYYKVDDRTILDGTNSSQKSNNLEFILSPGYAHTFVVKKNFYVSGGAFPGAGLVRTKLTTRLPSETIETKDNSIIYIVDAYSALGFDNGRFFAGAQILGSWSRRSQAEGTSTIFDDRLTYEVFIGYRFNAPTALKNLLSF